MKTKILIEVRGGLVQNISTNTSEVEIYLIDYDNSTHEGEAEFQYYRSQGDDILTDEAFMSQLFLKDKEIEENKLQK